MQALRAALNWIFAFAALFWLFFTVVFPIIISHSADLWDARAIVGVLSFEAILPCGNRHLRHVMVDRLAAQGIRETLGHCG